MDKNQQNHKTTPQKILDLIMEECRYWHGRNDEARRGSFAILYAAAKELVDDETLRLEGCKCEGLCEQRGLASDEVDATCRAVHGGTAPEQGELEAFATRFPESTNCTRLADVREGWIAGLEYATLSTQGGIR